MAQGMWGLYFGDKMPQMTKDEVEKFLKGFRQQLKGERLNEFVGQFLDAFREADNKGFADYMEEIGATLYGMKDSRKFQKHFITAMAAAYFQGTMDEWKGTSVGVLDIHSKAINRASRKLAKHEK
jgi:hypothetical protein